MKQHFYYCSFQPDNSRSSHSRVKGVNTLPLHGKAHDTRGNSRNLQTSTSQQLQTLFEGVCLSHVQGGPQRKSPCFANFFKTSPLTCMICGIVRQCLAHVPKRFGNFVVFTAWRVCIARTMSWQDVCLSVSLSVFPSDCLSVCLSHAGIVCKWLYMSSKLFSSFRMVPFWMTLSDV